MTNVVASPPRLVAGTGVQKDIPFQFTQVGAGGGAGDVARLVQLPGGARLLTGMCMLANSIAGGAVLINLGWETYTTPAGVVVAASPAGLVTGLSLVAGSLGMRSMTGGSAVGAYTKTFEGPVVLIATSTGGAFPAGMTLDGVIVWI